MHWYNKIMDVPNARRDWDNMYSHPGASTINTWIRESAETKHPTEWEIRFRRMVVQNDYLKDVFAG